MVLLAREGNTNKIALFKEGDVIPENTTNINWISTATGSSGINLDKIQLNFLSGSVTLDELRLGSTIKSVTKDFTYNTQINAPTNLSISNEKYRTN